MEEGSPRPLAAPRWCRRGWHPHQAVTWAPTGPRLPPPPQGTTSNGKCLLPFKTGAFLAGLPVQPIILKYADVRGEGALTPHGAVGADGAGRRLGRGNRRQGCPHFVNSRRDWRAATCKDGCSGSTPPTTHAPAEPHLPRLGVDQRAAPPAADAGSALPRGDVLRGGSAAPGLHYAACAQACAALGVSAVLMKGHPKNLPLCREGRPDLGAPGAALASDAPNLNPASLNYHSQTPHSCPFTPPASRSGKIRSSTQPTCASTW
jgi:hypothetical protein